jgi:general secretion pathway protein G
VNQDRKNKRNRRIAGVTLIEMLVVVTIIALFLGVVGVKMFRHTDNARITATRAQIKMFMMGLETYKMETGVFPTTEQGLAALRLQPEGVNNWHGPYLEQDVPVDPWGRAYVYKYPGDHGDSPEIMSYGADGQPGGEGINADIVSWKNN